MALDLETREQLIDTVRRFVTERLRPLEAKVSEDDAIPAEVIDEMKGLATSAPVVELSRQVEDLEKERAERVSRAAALARLASFGWDAALGAVRDDVERITIERSAAVRSE